MKPVSVTVHSTECPFFFQQEQTEYNLPLFNKIAHHACLTHTFNRKVCRIEMTLNFDNNCGFGVELPLSLSTFPGFKAIIDDMLARSDSGEFDSPQYQEFMVEFTQIDWT